MFAFFQFTSIKVNPYSKAERKKWDTVSTISEMQSPQEKEIHMAK